MKAVFYLAAVMAMLSIVACNEKEEDIYVLKPITEVDGNEFVGDTATLYHFTDSKKGFTVLTSEAEFEKYFDGDKVVEKVEKIDFEKSNMLVASGTSNYGVAYVLARVEEAEDGMYDINLMVQKNMLCVIEPWCATLAVPKEVTKGNCKGMVMYKGW